MSIRAHIRSTALLALGSVSMLIASATAPARADPLLIERDGPYIHRGSGYVFPRAVGAFERTRIIEYDAQAEDVSAGYALRAPGREMIATIYIYPAPPVIGTDRESVALQRQVLCREHFEGIKQEIFEKHPSAKLLEEGMTPSPAPQKVAAGHHAVFDFEEEFWGKVQPLRSQADLFCYFAGKWLIAYRVSGPKAVDQPKEIAELLSALPWPEPE